MLSRVASRPSAPSSHHPLTPHWRNPFGAVHRRPAPSGSHHHNTNTAAVAGRGAGARCRVRSRPCQCARHLARGPRQIRIPRAHRSAPRQAGAAAIPATLQPALRGCVALQHRPGPESPARAQTPPPSPDSAAGVSSGGIRIRVKKNSLKVYKKSGVFFLEFFFMGPGGF